MGIDDAEHAVNERDRVDDDDDYDDQFLQTRHTTAIRVEIHTDDRERLVQ